MLSFKVIQRGKEMLLPFLGKNNVSEPYNIVNLSNGIGINNEKHTAIQAGKKPFHKII